MDKVRTIITAAARVVVVLIAVLRFTDAIAFSPVEARNVVDRVVDLISNNYVVPEERAAIVAALRANEAAGRYDVSEAGALVDRLSPDLAAAGNDKHLWITFDPAQNAALRKPAEHGSVDNFSTLQGRLHNQGYEALRVLPGNVRYLNLTQFHWNGWVTARAVGDSARFLTDGDAVIIDLRENGGGSGEAVQALISYFLPPDRRKLMTFREGAKGPGTSTYVLGELRGPRMVGKPLYVLISSATGSAAEEFAYHVAMFKLGTLVGSTTAGAANNDTLYPVGEDFVLSVSTGRPEHPVSHANWQGVGVSADVNVAADKALDAAHLLALKQLSTRAGTDPARYAWIVAGLEGRLAPPQVDADTLRAYAGIYGMRRISVDNGSLIFQRATGAPTILSPIAPDLFALASTERVRLRFRRSATGIAGFDLIDENGAIIPVDRTS
jgi:hypothetical protein